LQNRPALSESRRGTGTSPPSGSSGRERRSAARQLSFGRTSKGIDAGDGDVEDGKRGPIAWQGDRSGRLGRGWPTLGRRAAGPCPHDAGKALHLHDTGDRLVNSRWGSGSFGAKKTTLRSPPPPACSSPGLSERPVPFGQRCQLSVNVEREARSGGATERVPDQGYRTLGQLPRNPSWACPSRC
jgi:hypothetical protein